MYVIPFAVYPRFSFFADFKTFCPLQVHTPLRHFLPLSRAHLVVWHFPSPFPRIRRRLFSRRFDERELRRWKLSSWRRFGRLSRRRRRLQAKRFHRRQMETRNSQLVAAFEGYGTRWLMAECWWMQYQAAIWDIQYEEQMSVNSKKKSEFGPCWLVSANGLSAARKESAR